MRDRMFRVPNRKRAAPMPAPSAWVTSGVRLLVAATLLITGCAGLKRRGELGKPADTATTGKLPAAPAAGATPPAMVRPKARKVGIVIGPGGAKTLAAAGVLKEFQRARIPVHSVVGLEWGAVVGGLFAINAQANEMEWKLYKLERQSLPGAGFLSSKIKPAEVASIRNFLRDGFAQAAVGRTAVEFTCPSQSLDGPDWRWAERGDAATEVEFCLAYPPLYAVDRVRFAGAFAAEGAIERLRAKGADVVILINVLSGATPADPRQLPDSAASVILWQEVRRSVRQAAQRADEFVEINTEHLAITDFARRKELIAAGERAAQDVIKRLITKYGF